MGASSSMEATRLPHNIVVTHKILGEGAYGVVYEGYYATASSIPLAIKEFKEKKYFLEELKIARQIKDQFKKCPSYFMCMVDYVSIPEDGVYYIVYKKASSDLSTYMKHLGVKDRGKGVATRSNPMDLFYMANLDDTNIYNVINTMVNILEKLEKLKISHRDIKMANILVDNGVPIDIILGDMGLVCSRKGSPVKVDLCSRSLVSGTPDYFPPYIKYLWSTGRYANEDQTVWQDVYATGATLYSFLTGMFPNIEKGSPLLNFPRDIKPIIDGSKYRIPREVINKLVNTMVFAPNIDLALKYKDIWKKYKNLQNIKKRRKEIEATESETLIKKKVKARKKEKRQRMIIRNIKSGYKKSLKIHKDPLWITSPTTNGL